MSPLEKQKAITREALKTIEKLQHRVRELERSLPPKRTAPAPARGELTYTREPLPDYLKVG